MLNWHSLINLSDIPNLPIRAANSQATLTPLDQHTLILATGPDTNKFLQGQCTCDINRLARNDIFLGAHCTQKGRMTSSFHLGLINSETVGLRIHKSIDAHALAQFKKYSVFSKVELFLTNKLIGAFLTGNEIVAIFKSSDIDIPAIGQASHNSSVTLWRHGEDQFEMWAETDYFKKFLSSFSHKFQIVSENNFDLFCIRQGIGEVRATTVDAFLPQELNFHLVDAISFSKGCYIGQEIVARLHYKGKLKKHMYRGIADATDNSMLPQPGDTLYFESTDKPAGTLIFSAINENHQLEALALVADDIVGKDSVVLANPGRTKLSWSTLPYAIP